MINKALGIAALAAALALPAATFAQTFAYVNTAGEVTTVEAADANTALKTAPGISLHSGVMLLQNSNDGIVGDSVTGGL
ncbi:MAG TPA: hypothetical protein VN086_00745 [Candidatus Paceibacterota bacterium]|nr:hypothetical protein [Candidatus Paceibacterota bacterium]